MPTFFTSNLVKVKQITFLVLALCNSFTCLRSQNTTISVLNDGTIYKMRVQQTGIYKLDYNFLKNALKIDNLDAIDPRTIKLYGNGGGMLPESNSAFRYTDLAENAITVVGEEDGKFDPSDYILFYSVGTNKWLFDATKNAFDRPKNIYDDNTYYYLKVSGSNGSRVIQVANPVITTTYQSNSYNYHERVEEDKINVLGSTPCNCTQGSGKVWVGDAFSDQFKTKDYSDKFKFTNIVPSSDANINFNFVAASSDLTSVDVNLGAKTFSQYLISSNPNDNELTNASNGSINQNFSFTGNKLSASINYQATSGSRAWLDYLQLTYRRSLIFENTPFDFRDISAINKTTTYSIAGGNTQLSLWNISNPVQPFEQKTTFNAGSIGFNTKAVPNLQEYILFDKSATLLSAQAVGKISNQNIHGIGKSELVIVYPKEFRSAAQKLQQHKLNVDGISTSIVEIGELYNEFSSGAQDPAAIRDFARFLYKRDSTFKYLLLFGDGSFDYKGLYDVGSNTPSNFIPVYESDESFSPIDAYTSDDFFALLSDNEGVGLEGDLDIGVGRIPCKTNDEAMAVVNKIIRYETQSFGAWRNDVTFLCDNGDNNLHLEAMDGIAQTAANAFPKLNVDKFYLDAYKLEVSAGGSRAPSMNDAIFQKSQTGTLTMCYMGHGGARGLAQERILMREDLAAWQNIDRLPLFITATCSFSGFDNPKEISAGETAILNPNGGAIALFSTVRLVEAGSNAQLTAAVFSNIYQKRDGLPLRLGEIFMKAKNNSFTFSNGQKFMLLGDPSLRLNLPRYNVQLSSINNKTVSAFRDTVKALQTISLSGTITNESGTKLTNFNGTLDCSLFDKTKKIQTLGQIDGSPAETFLLQKNILFKGSASVKNGDWTISFSIPKDIDFNCGTSKLSFYATDGKVDANGIFDALQLCKTDSTVAVSKPPLINLFLNDTNFMNGGSVGTSPNLIVQLSDEIGINVSGNSIGHDLTLNLDNTKSPINLNGFYQALRDNSKSGVASYTLTNLALGNHTLSVKAWNLNNISAEASINFIVVDNASVNIDSVFSFPNPFAETATIGAQYSSDKTVSNIRLTVYDSKGAVVKTITNNAGTKGNNTVQFTWSPKFDGDGLADGLYLFVMEFDTKDANSNSVVTRSAMRKIVFVR